MKHIVKLILALFLIFSIAACTKPEPVEEVQLQFIAPMGAPALTLVEVAKDKKHVVSFVSGTDNLTAAFVNPNPQYDVILAPINLGVTLISKGSTTYRLWGIATWGNLYIIAQNEEVLREEGTIALFGENAVPQRVFNTVKDSFELNLVPNFAPSVNDAVAQLISGNAEAAMVAEPLLTATLANHSQLRVVVDMQEQWKEVTGKSNYPQAAIFVEASRYELYQNQIDAQLNGMKLYLEAALNDSSQLKSDIDAVDPMTLGLPSSAVSVKALQGMNVKIQPAAFVLGEIEAFLELFNLNDTASYLLP